MDLFKKLLDHLPVATIVLSNDDYCFYANSKATHLLQHQIIDTHLKSLFSDQDRSYLKNFLIDETSQEIEFYCSKRDKWFLFKKSILTDQNHYIILSITDINEKKQRELYEKPLLRISELSTIATLLIDQELKITYANQFFYKLYQYNQPIVGTHFQTLSGEENPKEFVYNVIEIASKKGIWQGDDIRKKGNGTLFHTSSTITRITDQEGSFLCYADISRDNLIRTQKEASLKELLTKDSLTGIPNRRSFDQTFQNQWKKAVKNGAYYAVIMCDIDYFKRYNDHYGHLAGDECLRLVAETLDDSIRKSDFVARYGGEEFVILLPKSNQEIAFKVAEKLRLAIQNLKIEHQKTELFYKCVTISIGVAITSPQKSDDPQSLIEAADKALYRAKNSGRNKVSF